MYFDPRLCPLILYKGSNDINPLSDTLGRCIVCKKFQDDILDVPALCSQCQQFSHKRCRTSESLALRQSCLRCNTAINARYEGQMETERAPHARRAEGDTPTSIPRKRPYGTVLESAPDIDDELYSPINGVTRRTNLRETPLRVVQKQRQCLESPEDPRETVTCLKKLLTAKQKELDEYKSNTEGVGRYLFNKLLQEMGNPIENIDPTRMRSFPKSPQAVQPEAAPREDDDDDDGRYEPPGTDID